MLQLEGNSTLMLGQRAAPALHFSAAGQEAGAVVVASNTSHASPPKATAQCSTPCGTTMNSPGSMISSRSRNFMSKRPWCTKNSSSSCLSKRPAGGSPLNMATLILHVVDLPATLVPANASGQVLLAKRRKVLVQGSNVANDCGELAWHVIPVGRVFAVQSRSSNRKASCAGLFARLQFVRACRSSLRCRQVWRPRRRPPSSTRARLSADR